MSGRRHIGAGSPARSRTALAVLAGVLALGSGVGLMATSAWLISRAAQHPPVLVLMVAIVSVRAFGIGRGVFRYAERLVGHDAALRSLTALRVRVFARLVPLAPGGLPAFRRGDLLSRFVADVDAEQDRLVRVLVPTAVAGVVGGAAVLLATGLLPVDGLVLLVALVVAGVVGPWLTARAGARAERRLATSRGVLAAELVETLHGVPDLLAYGAVDARLARVAAADADLTSLARRSAWAAGLGAGLSGLATGAALVGALVVGVPAVRAGSLGGVWLATLVLVPLALAEVVGALPAAVTAAQRVRASLPAGPRDLRLGGVRARWRADAPLALDGVDLDLPVGRRVAVVGPSGAGKSTLAAVLVRFCGVESGTATLGGVALTALDSDDVRRAVVLCAQDAHLFDTSIRENLLLARGDADRPALEAALASARLASWVASLPDGLDTPVGEHGTALSGGQRQRLALARALLADPSVLVLDEPTANLDVPTADALTRDLLAATEGRTTLLVTHRLAELHRVDEVLVLDGGRVVQRGRHEALVRVPGLYRDLWEREVAAAGRTPGARQVDHAKHAQGSLARPARLAKDGHASLTWSTAPAQRAPD